MPEADYMSTSCKNCGYGAPLGSFIKENFPNLLKDYGVDCFKSTGGGYKAPKREPITKTKPNVVTQKPKVDIKPISSLPDDHPCVLYVKNRKIPDDKHKYLFYTPDFKKLANAFNEESSKKLQKNDSRLVIPFYDKAGNMIAFQGRTLGDAIPKYITIKKSDDIQKIYGLFSVDESKPIRVVEGPIDSLFIANCVATCDANLIRYSGGDVYIFDNQPRNVDVLKQMESVINAGKSIVIWPKHIKSKDINDMITDEGKTIDDIEKIITENTFSLLGANLKFNQWKAI